MVREQLQGRVRRVALTAVAAGLAFTGTASAATFKPTRFDDPPPGNCTPNNCSLREAIAAANDQGGSDEIVLQKGTYELEILGDQPDGGDLEPSSPVELRGKGVRETKIDANGIDRPISFGCGQSTTGGLAIKRLTLKGGDPGANPANCLGPGDVSVGGGILTFGKALRLENVAIRGNAAALGGGIRSLSEKLTIKNSTIAGNNASEGGGLDLRASDPQPLARIRSSTISGNTAFKGGGILADGFETFVGEIPPILDVDNSTVAGNNASGQGGGVFGDNDSIVVLDNTTVAYNMADSDNIGGGVGGGIHQFNDASFQLNDSVLALNTVGSSGSGPACDGEFEDGGSLVDTTGSNPNCDFVGLFPPTVTTTPLIGTLEDNGGPTKTIKLLSGSPAIGIAFDCPNLDQRGRERPDEDCDAGSFERKNP